MADVRLDPMAEAHLPHLFAIQLDPDARHRVAFTAEDSDDEDAYLRRWRRIVADPQITARVVHVGDTVVGSAVAFPVEGELDVTYWLAKEYWGRGIGTRVLDLLLAEIDTRPVFGRVAHDNTASARVLRRNGFVPHHEELSFAGARGREITEIVYVLE